MSKLTMPKVSVTLDDGTEHVVQTLTADAIEWDITRAKRKWPAVDKTGSAAVLWLSFISWHALHRTGATEQTWEEFSSSVMDVSSVEETTLDPTRSDHTPD